MTPPRRRKTWTRDEIMDANLIRGPESSEKAARYVEQGVMTADAEFLLKMRQRTDAYLDREMAGRVKRLQQETPSVTATALAACLRDCYGHSYTRIRRVVELATGRAIVNSKNTGTYVRHYHGTIPQAISDAMATEQREYDEEMAVDS